MFRDRIEELNHLIELYQRSSEADDKGDEFDHSDIKTKINPLHAEVESFATVMIDYTLQDRNFDIQFANKVYEFDAQLFLKIFNTAIKSVYSSIGFNEILRIVGEVKYFGQAIEGYKTIYDQIKDNLSDFHEQSYKLREKLEKMVLMKDFSKLPENERSVIDDMINCLEPYAMLPKPTKSNRSGNWAEHYFHLGCIEKEFVDEKNKFYSLFRTET